jgi:hypothetical protein
MLQIFVALMVSLDHGASWYWICPAVMLLLIPQVKKRSWVIVDEEGVYVGGTTSVLWAEVVSLAKRGWMRTVFVLKDGGRESLWTSDWPTERKEEFYELLRKRGLCDPMANQEGTRC